MGLTFVAELVRMEGYLDMAEISMDSQAALCTTNNMRRTVGQYLLDKFQDKIQQCRTGTAHFPSSSDGPQATTAFQEMSRQIWRPKQQQAGTRALHVFCPSHARPNAI